jgi:hypothetical protein
VSRGPIVLQYGCLDNLRRPNLFSGGGPPGRVRFTISVAEMEADLERCRLVERARFWILRGWSTSVVVLAGKK